MQEQRERLSRKLLSLLSERIRQTHIAIKNIKRDRSEVETQLEAIVGASVFADCRERFKSAHKLAFEKTRTKQKVKLSKLITNHHITEEKREKPIVKLSNEQKVELKKKWVYNISSKQLTTHQTRCIRKMISFHSHPAKTSDYRS